MTAPFRLRRLARWIRDRGPKCTVDRCPGTQLPSMSVWCRDHSDAILAGGAIDRDGDIARRVGARRWLLLAEVAVERERAHVAFLEELVAADPRVREMNWPVWTGTWPSDMTPSAEERVAELLALLPPDPPRPAPPPYVEARG